MNPLYQALICCLVKLVLSIRKVMSSLDSFLLDFPPIFRLVVCVGGDRDDSAGDSAGRRHGAGDRPASSKYGVA